MTRALLIIDIQNDYFSGGVLPLHQSQDVETRIVKTIQCASKTGDRIILVRHISQSVTGLFAANANGNAIRPDILKAATGAPVVIKKFADAFQDTDLSNYLKGVTDLLICGMMTQNCVVFTAMSELAKGYNVTIIGDLCTAPTEIVHKIALNALASKLNVQSAADIWPE